MIDIEKMKQKEKRYAIFDLGFGGFMSMSKYETFYFKSISNATLFDSYEAAYKYIKKLSRPGRYQIVKVKIKHSVESVANRILIG